MMNRWPHPQFHVMLSLGLVVFATSFRFPPTKPINQSPCLPCQQDCAAGGYKDENATPQRRGGSGSGTPSLSGPLICLALGCFDPLSESLSDPASSFTLPLMQQQALPTDGYYLVQFKGPIEPTWREALVRVGARILAYIPHFAFIVKMDAATKASVEGMEAVRWVGPYWPAYRVSPHLVGLRATESAIPVRLTVVVFQGEDLGLIVGQLRGLGGTVLEAAQSRWEGKIQIQIASPRVSAIARIPGVEWVEPSPQWELANDKADDILGIREVWDTHGLHGAGQVVAVCDTGLDQGSVSPADLHDDFEDGLGHSRVVAIHDVAGDGDPRDHRYPHGTHVAGSVLGNGLHSGSNPDTHAYPSTCIAGMAPEANLVFQAANHNGQPSNRLSLPSDLDSLFEQALSSGAHIHTNSWGSEADGAYTSYAQDVDEFVWDHKDFVILFAAGNYAADSDQDGVVDLGSMAAPATAKNCITVGAAEGDRPTGGGKDILWGMEGWFPAEPLASDHFSDDPGGMAAYSGRGPTVDGRVKPDLVAPGTNVLSVRSTAIPTSTDVLLGNYAPNPYYAWGWGTSVSTPLVAGAAALVREYYVTQGLLPSAVLVKATLINGATDLSPGQYGTGPQQEIPDPPRPNNVQGWGRVDVQSSLFPPAPGELHYEDDANGLETGQIVTYTFKVDDSAVPLRVTLAWSDYPGSPAAGGGLVNDLDLTITGPDQLDYSPPTDRLNNVEGVDIVAPPSGLYTIRVSGYNVPQGPQPFALVVTGAGEAVPVLHVSKSASSPSVEAGQTLTYTIVVTNADSFAAAESVVITDTLPEDVVFAWASDGGVYSPGLPQRVVWDGQAVLPGQNLGLSLAVSVPASLADGTVLTNLVAVRSLEGATATATITTTVVYWDITPPTGSILINEDDEFANSTAVTLTFSAWDESGVEEMMLSNQADFAGSTWEAFVTERPWTLMPDDGIQMVYVKFKDGGGSASGAFSDTIFLDTTPPSSTLDEPGDGALLDGLTMIGGHTSDPAPSSGLANIELQVTDGSYYLRADDAWASTPTWFTPDGGVAPVWTHHTAGVVWSDGTYTLTVRATDQAGNMESPAPALTFTMDAPPPDVTVISPNGGEEWPANSQQTIRWLASDPHLASQPITVSYSLDGGASWAIIAAGVTNSGSLVWGTPFTATLQGLVKVEAVDELGHTGDDFSDDVFAILPSVSPWSRVYLPIIMRAADLSSESLLLPSVMPVSRGHPR